MIVPSTFGRPLFSALKEIQKLFVTLLCKQHFKLLQIPLIDTQNYGISLVWDWEHASRAQYDNYRNSEFYLLLVWIDVCLLMILALSLCFDLDINSSKAEAGFERDDRSLLNCFSFSRNLKLPCYCGIGFGFCSFWLFFLVGVDCWTFPDGLLVIRGFEDEL